MVDVIVADDAFIQGQVHPMTVQRAITLMKLDPPKAKGKWQQIVQVDEGCRLALNCHKEGDKIVITGIRQLKRGKVVGPPRR
jgi:hypothetical protein